jgi:putative FmdB family regulatory protein
MPIYEYVCDACGERFEKLMRSYQTDAPACPSCGGMRVTMQLSTFAAHSGSSKAASGADGPGGCPSGMCRMPEVCGRN